MEIFFYSMFIIIIVIDVIECNRKNEIPRFLTQMLMMMMMMRISSYDAKKRETKK